MATKFGLLIAACCAALGCHALYGQDYTPEQISDGYIANRSALGNYYCEIAASDGYCYSVEEALKSGPTQGRAKAQLRIIQTTGGRRYDMECEEVELRRVSDTMMSAGPFDRGTKLASTTHSLTYSPRINLVNVRSEQVDFIDHTLFDMIGQMPEAHEPHRMFDRARRTNTWSYSITVESSKQWGPLVNIDFIDEENPNFKFSHTLAANLGFVPVRFLIGSMVVVTTQIEAVGDGIFIPARVVMYSERGHDRMRVCERVVTKFEPDTASLQDVTLDLPKGTKVYSPGNQFSGFLTDEEQSIGVQDLDGLYKTGEGAADSYRASVVSMAELERKAGEEEAQKRVSSGLLWLVFAAIVGLVAVFIRKRKTKGSEAEGN